jgi:hypothetical protein
MRVLVIVGTEKGAFLCRSNDGRRQWEVDGPLFKGWKVTASASSESGVRPRAARQQRPENVAAD